MDSLLVLIPMTVLLVLGLLLFFVFSVRSGQYDDLEGPAHRILMDDDDPNIPVYKMDNDKKGKDKKSKTTDKEENDAEVKKASD